jgi:hypothetical protein
MTKTMKKLSRKEDAVGAWEDEGGALAPADCRLKSPAVPDPGLKCVPSGPIADKGGRRGKSSAARAARHRLSRPPDPGVAKLPTSR